LWNLCHATLNNVLLTWMNSLSVLILWVISQFHRNLSNAEVRLIVHWLHALSITHSQVFQSGKGNVSRVTWKINYSHKHDIHLKWNNYTSKCLPLTMWVTARPHTHWNTGCPCVTVCGWQHSHTYTGTLAANVWQYVGDSTATHTLEHWLPMCNSMWVTARPHIHWNTPWNPMFSIQGK
jgi:hypothetical protein